jgi:hypothetical protein
MLGLHLCNIPNVEMIKQELRILHNEELSDLVLIS